MRLGGNGEGSNELYYRDDRRRAERFYAPIRRYWPRLPQDSLSPGYAGIRPKTVGPGEPASDFEIQGPRVHGIEGLVHLFGIESPGLTASLALAEAGLQELGEDSRTDWRIH